MPRFVFRLSLALIIALALWLRVRELAHRPMHADEANQAVKLGELLGQGDYRFDPRDHHGPTLYYLALPMAWVRGQHTLAQLDETTVRMLPALAGTAVVGLVAWLAAAVGLGGWPALAAAMFVALSPPSVYYSRYFIQETLLVAFTLWTFVAACRWRETGRLNWAAGAGLGAGLMLATKEVAPMFLVAAGIAVAVARGFSPRFSPSSIGTASNDIARKQGGLKPALLLAICCAVATVVLFYSSFFTHFGGLRDALTSYAQGSARATGGVSGHEKPWWYYLRLFGWQRSGGLLWDEVAFSALAVGGVAVAFARRERGLMAVAIYTLLVGVILSSVPYKTPWHAVHFVPGMALLAAAALYAMSSLRTGTIVAALFGVVTVLSLAAQTWRASFIRPADARNPFAYVHSSPDVLKFRPLADAARRRFPEAPIRVISEEYWPLPWYFRGLPNVGYWNAPPEDCDGALVVASASEANAVRERLHGTYHESFVGLRPGFVCVVFAKENPSAD